MSRFTTRIELHYASQEDYTRLHQEMLKENFSHTINGGDGVEYYLPPAEYNFVGDCSLTDVRTKAERAATKTTKKHAVLVTMGERCWSGLKQVESAKSSTKSW